MKHALVDSGHSHTTLQVFHDSKNHAGESFYIGDYELKVNHAGKVRIPQELFDEFGTENIDGKKVLALVTGGIYEEGEMHRGAVICTGEHIDEVLYDKTESDILTASELYSDDLEILNPSDTGDIYFG